VCVGAGFVYACRPLTCAGRSGGLAWPGCLPVALHACGRAAPCVRVACSHWHSALGSARVQLLMHGLVSSGVLLARCVTAQKMWSARQRPRQQLHVVLVWRGPIFVFVHTSVAGANPPAFRGAAGVSVWACSVSLHINYSHSQYRFQGSGHQG
jgi:hypothetical protein